MSLHKTVDELESSFSNRLSQPAALRNGTEKHSDFTTLTQQHTYNALHPSTPTASSLLWGRGGFCWGQSQLCLGESRVLPAQVASSSQWPLTDVRGHHARCQPHIKSNLGSSIFIKDTSTCSSAQLGAGIWTSDFPITRLWLFHYCILRFCCYSFLLCASEETKKNVHQLPCSVRTMFQHLHSVLKSDGRAVTRQQLRNVPADSVCSTTDKRRWTAPCVPTGWQQSTRSSICWSDVGPINRRTLSYNSLCSCTNSPSAA